MHIHGTSQVHGTHGVKGPHSNSRASDAKPSKSSSPTDQVEISPAGEAAAQAAETGEIRTDLVARVRQEIASGTYETPEKLDAALDRFLNEVI